MGSEMCIRDRYSLMPEAAGRLDYCIEQLNPRLVYAADGDKFGAALSRDSLSSVEKLVSDNAGAGMSLFDEYTKGNADQTLAEAYESVGPDTLAKILFTSGSTGNPKGVPQTQRMLTVNQAQYLACLPMLAERPPVIVDWLPWNHVFAGNLSLIHI